MAFVRVSGTRICVYFLGPAYCQSAHTRSTALESPLEAALCGLNPTDENMLAYLCPQRASSSFFPLDQMVSPYGHDMPMPMQVSACDAPVMPSFEPELAPASTAMAPATMPRFFTSDPLIPTSMPSMPAWHGAYNTPTSLSLRPQPPLPLPRAPRVVPYPVPQQALEAPPMHGNDAVPAAKPSGAMAPERSRTKPGTKARPFSCSYCSRSFSRKHDLERHSRVHSGVRPYVCRVCHMGFPRSDALRRHIRIERDTHREYWQSDVQDTSGKTAVK